MIQVKMLNNNNIITLQKDGGLPIKSSQGFMFYNPNELLCVAVGACIGRNMVIVCSNEQIDIDSFEYVGVGMNNNKIEILIKFPEELAKEGNKKINTIRGRLEGCELITNLKKSYNININFTKNEVPTEQVVEANRAGKPCCGG